MPPIPCPDEFRLLHDHWADPIIIENPPASFKLIPPKHQDFLVPIGNTGRDWNLLDKNFFTGIYICVDNFLWQLPAKLDATASVTIVFDDVHPHSGKKAVEEMTIQWTPNRTVEFRGRKQQGAGASWDRKPQHAQNPDGLDCPQGHIYIISSVEFIDRAGVKHSFTRPGTANAVKVVITVD
jgi:hypothetical protein